MFPFLEAEEPRGTPGLENITAKAYLTVELLHNDLVTLR